MLATLIFFLFSVVLIGAALMVITARNPVHAVLYLILCFFNAAGLFVLMGAEFLAMILVIVYVGAVAVLFLFVVMMLDIDFASLRQGFVRYLPIGALVGAVLLLEIGMLAAGWRTLVADAPLQALQQTASMVENTKAIGMVLYTDYALPFQLAGLVLLVAMIGAICLDIARACGVKRQQVEQQLDRQRSEVVALAQPATGAGVQIERGV